MPGSWRENIRRLVFILLGVMALAFSGLAFAATDTYTYDAYGRLASVTYADGSKITYIYDPAGNRTVLTQTATP